MSQPGQRQTKKQKKALAFRTRQKTSKKKHKDQDDDRDALDFPVDENQDVAGLADLPLESGENSASGEPGGRKGKAKDGGQHQPQPKDSKKRRRDSEEMAEEKPRKKSKAQPTISGSGVEDDDGQKAVEVKGKVQPQRFILFIGAYSLGFVPEVRLIHVDCRQSEILYNKGRHPFSFLLLWYGRPTTWFSLPSLTCSC